MAKSQSASPAPRVQSTRRPRPALGRLASTGGRLRRLRRSFRVLALPPWAFPSFIGASVEQLIAPPEMASAKRRTRRSRSPHGAAPPLPHLEAVVSVSVPLGGSPFRSVEPTSFRLDGVRPDRKSEGLFGAARRRRPNWHSALSSAAHHPITSSCIGAWRGVAGRGTSR